MNQTQKRTPLVFVEGPRNVGKSHLIRELPARINTYKLPFTDYFDAFISGADFMAATSSRDALHFTSGFDVALLTMHRDGLITDAPIVVDRGFISNIVLAVQQERFTLAEGKAYMGFLHQWGMIQNVRVVNIAADYRPDERNKDAWNYLSQAKSVELFDEFLTAFAELTSWRNVSTVYNTFDAASVARFNTTVQNMFN